VSPPRVRVLLGVLQQSCVWRGGPRGGRRSNSAPPSLPHPPSPLAALSPALNTLGAVLWLIGSALFAGAQKRNLFTVVAAPSGPIFPTAAVVDGSLHTSACVLFIVAACAWLVGAVLHLLTAHAQVAIVTVAGVPRPGLASWLLVSSWVQLISVLLLLIGSAIMVGGGTTNASGGAILLLAGFVLWGTATLALFGTSFVISTTVVGMETPTQKQFAWGSTTATLVNAVALLLLVVGSVALVVRDPPGLYYTGAVLYIVGASYLVFGTHMLSRETSQFFTPVLGFVSTFPFSGTTTTTAAAGGTTTTTTTTTMMGPPKGAFMAPASSSGVGTAVSAPAPGGLVARRPAL
jgi:hypothetical protein